MPQVAAAVHRRAGAGAGRRDAGRVAEGRASRSSRRTSTQRGKEGATFQRNEFADQVIARLAGDPQAPQGRRHRDQHPRAGPAGRLHGAHRDGGAIVIGAVTQKYTVAVKAGQPGAKVDPALAALAGGKVQFGKSFTRTAVEVVAFAVPKRGGGPITVFAAQKGDVAAAAS
jgi:hypothetical protein